MVQVLKEHGRVASGLILLATRQFPHSLRADEGAFDGGLESGPGKSPPLLLD